jgi:hypothetical protein
MARTLLLLMLAVLALAPTASTVRAATPAGPAASQTTTRALPAGSRIPWGDGEWYLHGANVPWFNWQKDFGGNDDGGASSKHSRETFSSTFAGAKANGANVLRWWVFEGDPWQVKRNNTGMPTGLEPKIYRDFDAALQIAEEQDIYYNFVLFSGASHVPKTWLSDPRQRKQLGNVLGELFSRYRDNPRILAWEVFNEPDNDVWHNGVDEEAMRSLVREVVDSIHANSNAYATMGMMMLDGLPMSRGLGLDFYQAHWYDYMNSGDWCASCHTYDEVRERWQLDAPLVLGEVYLGKDTKDPQERLQNFYDKGYAGAWPWSIFSDITYDKLKVNWGAMRRFAGEHDDLGPRVTEALAPSTEPDAPDASSFAFSLGAGLSSNRVNPGQRLSIEAKVSSETAMKILVDVEVYTMSGDKVHQEFWDGQSFDAGQTKTFTTAWTVPRNARPGDYVVKVGAFPPGWGTPYDFNGEAATFKVGG